jgi:hypothetical protein
MLEDPQFQAGEINTRYVPELLERWKRGKVVV